MSRADFERAVRDAAKDGGAVRVDEVAARVGVSRADAKGWIDAMYQAGELELDLDGDDFVYREKRRRGAPAPVEAAPSPAPKSAQKSAQRSAPTSAEKGPAKPEQRAADKRAADEAAKDETEEKSAIDAVRDAAAGALEPLRDNLRDNLLKEAAKRALGDDGEPKAGPKKSLAWGVGLGFFLPGAGLFYAAPWLTAVVSTLAVGLVLALLNWLPLIGGLLTYIVFGAFMLASGVLGGVYTYQFNKHGKRTRLSKATETRRALPF
jgi:pyruvate/2-oxoglutarate dehydrogenase complex dihydrolipoamide acyltransferase (E2) component